jgi:peptidoglycan/xylan/chitin deacetylase (PgdA/CDA1 family)
MVRVHGLRPERLPSALVLTVDNLGEASALERGTWSPGAALGHDPSVTRALPWLLDELGRHDLKATFFVEALNCELYPDAVTAIAAAGHELGHHGWSHEHWASLSPRAERDALTRGVHAFEALGLKPRGFRPPGGELTSCTPALLCEAGFDWCSPARPASPGEDDQASVEDGLVYVPFDWELVDAYHLMESFAAMRASRGDPGPPLDAESLAALLTQRIARAGEQQTLILHPFLMLDAGWRAGVARLLAAVAEHARAGRTWVVPGGAFAECVRAATRT